jgi:hypothetical protein
VSFAWERVSDYSVPDDEHPEGYVWEAKSSCQGYEQSVLGLYKDGYHVQTGVPLEEGFIFLFDDRAVER